MGRRRLGRKMKEALDPMLQWRRESGGETVIAKRQGIVTPLSFQRGRDIPAGNITFLTNPTFIIINPSTEDDGTPLNVAQGDLFVRLKYHETQPAMDAATPFDDLPGARQKELKSLAINAIHQILTVHSFETQFNSLRILGELQV